MVNRFHEKRSKSFCENRFKRPKARRKDEDNKQCRNEIYEKWSKKRIKRNESLLKEREMKTERGLAVPPHIPDR